MAVGGQHLEHEWARSTMIRSKLVAQTRGTQSFDQHRHSMRPRKLHRPVQIRSKIERGTSILESIEYSNFASRDSSMVDVDPDESELSTLLNLPNVAQHPD